jgi:hypothetical protein
VTPVLQRYDAQAMRQRCARAGLLERLQRKGFDAIEVVVDEAVGSLPHTRLLARKGGRSHLLLDACLLEAVVRPESAAFGAYRVQKSVELLVVHWVREQDPTMPFGADRPPLPLQKHPGLGVLRDAFHVAVGIAADLRKDGVASVPKFFHDAFIFFRSRLFLFLDGREQGRFEALVRDLRGLPLGDRSLALAGWCVRDTAGAVVRWTPGYQVFPESGVLTAYFHSVEYQAAVDRGLQESRFRYDVEALAEARRVARGAAIGA